MAAFEAAARGGVDAIAVEPIAASLGLSKGGFYYRFADRDELIAATLEHWSEHARLLMARCTTIADPVGRLRTFLTTAVADDQLRGADSWFFLHSSSHPLVRPVARRAAEENVAWFVEVLMEAGVPVGDAAARGRLCWSTYLGMVAELMVADPGSGGPRVVTATTDLLVSLLTARSDVVKANATGSKRRRR